MTSGIAVDVQNSTAETPLHQAVYSGDLEMARTLLEHGANVNAMNRRRQTPLHYAENDRDSWFVSDGPDHRPIAELLRKHGGKK